METLLKDNSLIIAAVMVLVISVGISVYNTSTDVISEAVNTVETESIKQEDAFNTQFESYKGAQEGSAVRSLISALISNANIYDEFEERLPDLYYEAARGNELVVTSTEGDPNIDDFYTAKDQIELSHTYYVSFNYSDETGLIDEIKVSYDPMVYGE